MGQFNQEIAKGIAFLDAIRPDWRNDINLSTLDMQSGADCILGQLSERQGVYGYSSMAGALSGAFMYDDRDDWAKRFGFYIPHYAKPADWRTCTHDDTDEYDDVIECECEEYNAWAQLTIEWIDAIRSSLA